MAEEQKTEATASAPAQEDSKAEKKELASLRKQVSDLEKEKTKLESELIASKKKLAELERADGGIIVMGSKLKLAGGEYEVTHIDTAWEIGQLESKSFIEEDATCLALKKL